MIRIPFMMHFFLQAVRPPPNSKPAIVLYTETNEEVDIPVENVHDLLDGFLGPLKNRHETLVRVEVVFIQ